MHTIVSQLIQVVQKHVTCMKKTKTKIIRSTPDERDWHRACRTGPTFIRTRARGGFGLKPHTVLGPVRTRPYIQVPEWSCSVCSRHTLGQSTTCVLTKISQPLDRRSGSVTHTFIVSRAQWFINDQIWKSLALLSRMF